MQPSSSKILKTLESAWKAYQANMMYYEKLQKELREVKETLDAEGNLLVEMVLRMLEENGRE